MRDGGAPHSSKYNIRIHQQNIIVERLVPRMTNFPLSPRSPDLTIYDAFLCDAKIPVFPTNSKKNLKTKIKQQTVFRKTLPNQCSKMVEILSN